MSPVYSKLTFLPLCSVDAEIKRHNTSYHKKYSFINVGSDYKCLFNAVVVFFYSLDTNQCNKMQKVIQIYTPCHIVSSNCQ